MYKLLTKNKLLKIHFNLKIINKTKINGAFTVIQDTYLKIIKMNVTSQLKDIR